MTSQSSRWAITRATSQIYAYYFTISENRRLLKKAFQGLIIKSLFFLKKEAEYLTDARVEFYMLCKIAETRISRGQGDSSTK